MSDRLTLRPAGAGDSELLLQWRNDAQTRAQSFSTSVVALEDHERWLSAKLTSPESCRIWIGVVDGQPVGQVRVDRREHDAVGMVSVSVAPDFRGRGLGALLIASGTAAAFDELGVESVEALVKPSNVASAAAFRRAGYEETGTEDGALVFTARAPR